MKLRIISGELKGRVLNAPSGAKGTSFRPTLERTRQSVAEIIKNRIPGSRCADICAGSGAFGFELLSRGARSVDFVEVDRIRANMIRTHAERFGVAGRCRIFGQDIRSYLRTASGGYDLAFYDPPYDQDELRELAPQLLKLLGPDGILIYEHGRVERNTGDRFDSRTARVESRVFGDTVVEFVSPVPPGQPRQE